MKYLLWLASFWIHFSLFAQDSLIIELRPVFGKEPLALYKNYAVAGDKIQIEMLKFYISNIQINGNQSVEETPKAYLIDLESGNLKIALPSPSAPLKSLKFGLGIDSTLHAAGAMGGDLDPVNGMYWSWQSGYIHFKLEGKSQKCTARHHRFQFHVGGYRFPFGTYKEIHFHPKRGKSVIIEIQIDKLLSEYDLSHQYEILSPSSEAAEFSKRFVAALKLRQ